MYYFKRKEHLQATNIATTHLLLELFFIIFLNVQVSVVPRRSILFRLPREAWNKIKNFRPLSEPIRLQNLENSARSQAKKKNNSVISNVILACTCA